MVHDKVDFVFPRRLAQLKSKSVWLFEHSCIEVFLLFAYLCTNGVLTTM
jgi:hypothetical protein